MGQQQILFVVLAVCIIGVAVSVGILSFTESADMYNRIALTQDLTRIAEKAQRYYKLPSAYGGGEGSFAVLNHMPDALGRLGFSSSNAHGDFIVKRSTKSSVIEIIGVGIQPGYDEKKPVRIMMTVWPDSTAVTMLN